MLDVDINATKCDPATSAPSHSCDAGTFFDRLVHWELWWRFVAIEHAVIATRVLIMAISPTEPDWVQDAIETLTFCRVRSYFT